MIIEKLKRHWARLAPKLIAFVATGLTSSGALFVLGAFGIHLSPTLAVLAVGGLSSTAAYILRDNLLSLAPGQLSVKVFAFVVTSVSAASLVAVAAEFGIDLSPYSVAIGLVLTAIAGVVGYLQTDGQIVSGPPIVPSSEVGILVQTVDAEARRTEQAEAAKLSADQSRIGTFGGYQ